MLQLPRLSGSVQLPRLSGSLTHSQQRQLRVFKEKIQFSPPLEEVKQSCYNELGEVFGTSAGTSAGKAAGTASVSLQFQLLHVHVTHLSMPKDSLTPGCEVVMLSPGKFSPYLSIKDNQYSFENKLKPTVSFLFGTDAVGQSICVKTIGFKPFVYVEIPKTSGFSQWCESIYHDCLQTLRLSKSALTVEVEWRHRAYGWVASLKNPSQRRLFPFVKFKCVNDNVRSAITKWLQKKKLDVSENQVSTSAQLMAELGLRSSAWVSVKSFVPCSLDQRQTYCQIECEAPLDALMFFEKEDIPPLLLLAFDIECNSTTGAFPDAKVDQVIYIGLTFWRHGLSEPVGRIMLVLGSCSKVPDTLVLSFDNEVEMIHAFRDIIVYYTDPDIVTGYNISGFDCAFLDDRLKTLCGVVDYQRTRFSFGSRLIGLHEPIHRYTKTSAAMGENEIVEFIMTGRMVIDMYMWMKINKKLTSYSLDFVSQLYVPQCTGKVKLVKPMWSVMCVDELLHGMKQEPRYLELPGIAPLLSQLELHTEEAYACWGEVNILGHENRQKAEAIEERFSQLFGVLITTLVSELNTLNDTLAVPLEPSEFVSNAFENCLTSCGDNNYKKMFAMYKLTDDDRANIAYYCAVDCDLTLHLMHKLAVIPDTVLMSRVTQTLLADISARGQQIKVFNQIYRFCHENQFVMNMRDSGWDTNAEFQGATVLPPTPNYYQDPIATLDFASLYPSIMQAHNLCFSTVILEEPEKHNDLISTSTYDIGNQKATFVNNETTKGILPSILQNLLSARKQAKKDMEAAADPFQQQIHNSRQLALKISANSMYGFTGVQKNGMYSCLWVANTVTLTGRGMIETTKNFVEANYPGVQVIYGDTDSVMCRFHRNSPLLEQLSTEEELMPRVFEVAEDMSKKASALFKAPNKLEFEKVYYPYLLIGKKNYVGMKYEGSPTKEPKMDAKGIEIVRRDKIAILRNTLKEILYLSLQCKNYEKAYGLLEDMVRKFVTGSITVDDVMTSKSLKSEYKSEMQPQLQVVKKMNLRKAFGVPRVGDRVPFVIIENSAEANMSLRAEHPDYAKRHNLTLDRLYYLTLVETALLRVLHHLPMPSLNHLFSNAKAELSRRILCIHDVTQFCTVSAVTQMVRNSAPKRKMEECKQTTLTGASPPKKSKKQNKKVTNQGSLLMFFK
jgi:DNA polymerase elongation subunit (family B)